MKETAIGVTKTNNRFKKNSSEPSDIYPRIGANIRELRKQYKITIEELSESANINASFMGNIERGQRKPTLYTLEKLAKALDVSLADIIGYEVIKNPAPETDILNASIMRILKGRSAAQKKKIYNIIKQL